MVKRKGKITAAGMFVIAIVAIIAYFKFFRKISPGTGTITVNNTNSASQPLGGQTLAIDGGIPVTVPSNGVYVFTNVPFGSHSVTTSLSGYTPTPASPQSATLSATSLSATVAFVWKATLGGIKQVLKIEDGKIGGGNAPLQGIKVILNKAITKITNSSGEVTFDIPVKGSTHLITINAAGYAAYNQRLVMTGTLITVKLK